MAACGVGSVYGHSEGASFTRRGWILAFLLAVLTFGVGLALRRRRTPRWLTWLGTISYSVYVVHPVLLPVSGGTIGRAGSWHAAPGLNVGRAGGRLRMTQPGGTGVPVPDVAARHPRSCPASRIAIAVLGFRNRHLACSST